MGDEGRMSLEFDRQALVSIFTAEASDGLDKLSAAVTPPTSDSSPVPDVMHQLFIVAHSLKGAAALYGYETASALAGILEKAFEQAVAAPRREWPNLVPLVQELVERLRRQMVVIQQTGAEELGSLDDLPGRFPDAIRFMQAYDALPDSYLIPELEPEVCGYFIPEAQEYLETITSSLLELEKDPEEVGELQRLFRAVHTLKGSAYTVGFQSVGDLTHELEDIVDSVLDGQVQLSPELTDRVFQGLDAIRLLLRRDPERLDACRTDFKRALVKLREGRAAWIATAPVIEGTATPAAAKTRVLKRRERVRAPAAAHAREATIRLRRDRLERLVNLVGELVIGRSRLEQRLMVLDHLSRQVLTYQGKLLNTVSAFEEKHAFSLPEPITDKLAMSPTGFLMNFGELEFDKYDDVNILARSMAEVSADIAESMAQLSTMIRQSREDMGRLQQLTLGLRDEIAQARMVPLNTLFTRFQKAVREMGRTAGKSVILDISGGDIELDTDVVQRLLDPVIHIIRNAVYHGIESSAAREAAGKPAAGTISLKAAHRGTAVLIEIKDDGAGLDVEKIKATAISTGLLDTMQAGALSQTEAMELIYVPGFSTASEVGDQAGRGVGMDVVKQAVEALNGHIDIHSEPGVGTTFTLRLPLTLLISAALIIRAGQQRFAVPLPAIREVIASAAHAVRHIDGRWLLPIGEDNVEVRAVAQLLGERMEPPKPTSPVVVLQAGQKVIGITVDELIGRQEIVIKALGPLAFFQGVGYSGVAIDPEGRIMLVLDVERLLMERTGARILAAGLSRMAVASSANESANVSATPDRSASRILLIDDSLSVRKFIGRMLQAAGYQVDTAVDGEEGLRKAALESYRLIITDLEMPKMNGYEVIQSLRELPHTRATPIMVMTTRAADKHRQIATNLGANAYITKPIEERSLILEVAQCLQTAEAKV
jgi:chemosensory pili system protein ChpA (sensor histidine kinase/response regulator)